MPTTRPSPRSRRRNGVQPAAFLPLALFAVLWVVLALTVGAPAWLGVVYAVASVVAFVLYAVDKSAARADRRRIPESTLLTAGLVGGWPGAIVAQQVLRHKTVKREFRVPFWITVVLNVLAFVAVCLLLG
ncbi:hypothetical protein ARHIZOSPH14_14190 [Agromyces rhizosphaerae]|uniref:DUF1294 domain-containing protein n=1 Tax=Agromyces rhizosphaerae TaxID=88374 RepID=A0A9W6CVC9_9MICO|nr:DUF1294 domain-containing protein [Agromyces rhizosphaerae]GLI27177.1 hypothetical protein ARHIZOSPH14_14190 [Agromyces rhizosphaerae]